VGVPVAAWKRKKRASTYFGIDPTFPYLDYAWKERDLKQLVWGVGESLPFKDACFDSALSGYFAFRYVNPKLVLAEVR